jgi:glucose-1-phosphate thymidylyltransferase
LENLRLWISIEMKISEDSRRGSAAIILGAGSGTRLISIAPPYTKTILPVNGLPVIAYATKAVASYVDKIVVVAHPSTATAVSQAAAAGIPNDRQIVLTLQHEPTGMADAIRIGLEALKGDYAAVILCGDNIVLDEQNVRNVLDCVEYNHDGRVPVGLAWTYLEWESEEASRFSVYQSLADGRGKLIEKPSNPPSNICWCGPIAVSSSKDALERIGRLIPSERGEYEATDLMNSYLMQGDSCRLSLTGEWFDIGTPAALQEARLLIENMLG